MANEPLNCHHCGMRIPVDTYICANCGRVSRQKVALQAGKRAAASKSAPAPSAAELAKSPPQPGAAEKTEGYVPTRRSVNAPHAPATRGRVADNVETGTLDSLRSDFDSLKPADFSTIGVSAMMAPTADAITVTPMMTPSPDTGVGDVGATPLMMPSIEMDLSSGFTSAPSRKRMERHQDSTGPAPLRSSCEVLNGVLRGNEKFAARYKPSDHAQKPRRECPLAVVTCMSSSLTGIIEDALGIGRGDAFLIRTEGAVISEGAASEVMRSLAMAVHMHGVTDIIVVAHDDCGLKGLTTGDFITAMKKNGVSRGSFDIPDMKSFVGSFSNFKESVRRSVSTIQRSGVIPESIAVHGLLLSMRTGKLEVIVNGYSERIASSN